MEAAAQRADNLFVLPAAVSALRRLITYHPFIALLSRGLRLTYWLIVDENDRRLLL